MSSPSISPRKSDTPIPSPDDKVHKDLKGRIYRPIICLKCGEILGYEFVFRGRLQLRCGNCGRIMILVFRQRKPGKRSGQK